MIKKIKEMNMLLDEQDEISNKVREEIFNDFKYSLVERDKKQEKVLTTSSNHYLVKGPAGSGKTIIALNKAYQLIRENETKFLIMIYTNALSRYLQGIVRKNISDYKCIEEKIVTEEQLKQGFKNYDIDYIIIDEVQDFSIAYINHCIKQAKKGYFLFGDNGQQLYPKKTDDKDIIEEVEKFEDIDIFKLDRTYRVPEKIARFAACIDRRDTHIQENCYRLEGDKPQIIEFDNINNEVEYICNRIKKEGWKNVGIILKKNDDVGKFAKLMNEHGIPCEQKKRRFDNLDFTTECPKVLTYHSSKGLEFERVFIPECSYNDEPGRYNYREALFVAITRAKETVVISYIEGNKNQFIDEFAKDTYFFSKKRSITV